MATKKETAKKVAKPKAVKAAVAPQPAKKEKKEADEVKRVAPQISRKAAAKLATLTDEELAAKKAAEARAFAMSIAQEMKRSAKQDATKEPDNGIRLSRRPTTRAQGKTTDKFPESDLKEFRKRLMNARIAAQNGINAMKATGFNETDDHEADGGDGTNQTLRLQALGQMGNINRTIQQIDEALHRIDDGTYGVCTVCGQLIRKPRLLNQPFVLTCMECQCEMERGLQGNGPANG